MISSDQQLLAAAHQNIITIAKDIETTNTKDEIRAILQLAVDRCLTPDKAQQKMESATRLAARLLSMIDIRPLPNNAYLGRSPLL